MTAFLIPQARQQFFNSAGTFLAGGKVYTYAAGTSTPLPTYQDAAGTIPNTNPVVLDARGEATIFWNGSYKVVLADASGVTIWTQDNVSQLVTSGDQISYVASGTGAVTRTVQDKLREIVTAKDFGAKGDGATSDNAALALVDATGPWVLGPGTYYISANLTLSSDIAISDGAKFSVAGGFTLTINGSITAGLYQIFSGTGTVVINGQKNRAGSVEWFGVVPGSSGAASANTTAMNAALVALPTALCQAADYWFSGTVILGLSNHRLFGAASLYDGATAGQATRFICTDATVPILQVGASSFPGSVNSMVQGQVAQDIFLVRSVAPSITGNGSGCLVQYCTGATVRNIKSVDSINGFRFNGTVGCYAIQCNSNRVTAGSGGGTDNWNGYWLDGSAAIGLAGGNASLYLIRCQAGCNLAGLQAANSNGYYLTSNFQDSFVIDCESVTCAIGANLSGGGANADVQFTHPVFDQCGQWGMYVGSFPASGTLNVTDAYLAGKTGTQFLLYVNGCAGTINFNGGQFLCGSVASLQAVALVNAVGIAMRGTIIKECAAIGVGTSGTSGNLIIETIHHNPTATGAQAIQLNGTAISASRFAPLIFGKASAFTYGIQVVGAIDTLCEYVGTGIATNSIAVSTQKINRNGTTVSTLGIIGATNNVASGVLA